MPYIAVGLLAIGLTHAARARDAVEHGALPAWLLAIGGAVAALMVFSLLFVLIDFSTAQKGMEYTLYGIGWVFAGIFYVAAWPVIKILEGIFWFIKWLADLNANPEPAQPLEPAARTPTPWSRETPLAGLGRDAGPVPGSRRRDRGAGHRVGALVHALPPQDGPGRPEGVDLQEGRLASDLGDLLGSLLGRFRSRCGPARVSEPVRRLYFDMLAAGEARGVERKPVETPLELSPRLETTFAAATPREITGLFDDVRYGAHEPSEARCAACATSGSACRAAPRDRTPRQPGGVRQGLVVGHGRPSIRRGAVCPHPNPLPKGEGISTGRCSGVQPGVLRYALSTGNCTSMIRLGSVWLSLPSTRSGFAPSGAQWAARGLSPV